MTATELAKAIDAEKRLSHQLGTYAGQWIAVRNHEVVAHAPKLRVLSDEVRRKQMVDLDGIRHVSANQGVCIL